MIYFTRILYTAVSLQAGANMYPLLPLLSFQLCFHGLTALLNLSFFLYIFGYFLFWQMTGKFKRGKVGSDWHQDPIQLKRQGVSPPPQESLGTTLAQRERRSEAPMPKRTRVLKVHSPQ